MKRGFTIWQLLLLLALLGIIAAILYPVFARSRETKKAPSCQSNLKQISLGMMQYVSDYDDKYPPFQKGAAKEGWVDAVYPYIKSRQVFQCPAAGHEQSRDALDAAIPASYWMNHKMFARKLNSIVAPAHTVLNGDGDSDMDPRSPHYAISFLPDAWINDTSSPRYRHGSGAYFSFADGHVKWLSGSEQISTASPTTTSYTFAPR